MKVRVKLCIPFYLMLMPFLLLPSPLLASQSPVTLQVVLLPSELTDEEIANFEAANPNIQIELVDWSTFSFDVAIALDEVPDIMRVQATDMQQLVQDGYVLDLTSYIETSDYIRIDDLVNAVNYYRFNDRYYGLPKDWSLDFSLYVYNPAFEAAGIPIPSTIEPLTYAELADLAEQLTLTDGEITRQYGFYSPYLERAITSIFTQRNISLFNSSFSEMHLTDNPEALEIIRYFYDMALNGSMYTQTSEGWNAMVSGQIAIFQYGYWFGGVITEEMPIYDQLTVLPAPTWDTELPRLNTTIGPTGIAISSTTQHPEAAYRFLEWYTVGEGAIERTKQGWGAPNLVSMFDQLPHETAFDQQRLDVLQSELLYSDWVLPTYPYQSIVTTFNESWEHNIELARAGEIDFNIFASNLQEAVNLAILNELLGS